MTWETGFVFVVLGGAAILFASGKVRYDVVALLVLLALALSRVLSVREALAGFGDPVVILVAGIFVVGEMLRRTGVAMVIGGWLVARGGASEIRLTVLLMLVSALLGSVMSSTATVAILIPVVQTISSKTRLNPSRLLLPMAFGALISGMMTLIATTPNLLVSAELEMAGHPPFNFFDFTPIGLAVLAVATLYMVLVGRRLLPGARSVVPAPAGMTMRELMAEYGVLDQVRRVVVRPGSALTGLPLGRSRLGAEHDLQLLLVERAGRLGTQLTVTPGPDFEIRAGDVLAMQDSADRLAAVAPGLDLELQPVTDRHRQSWVRELGMAAVLVSPESRLVGQTLKEVGFRGRFSLHVVALRRRSKAVEDFTDQPLQVGDSLLVVGAWREMARLRAAARDLVLFATPAEIQDSAPEVRRLPTALVILGAMVALTALEILPVVLAVILAALAAVMARTLTMEEGYRAIRWNTVVLIGGMLPVAAALQKTGGTAMIVGLLVESLGGAGPYAMMAAVFCLTAGLSLFLSNTATAVLVGPIAIQAALALGVAPQAFAMTVAIGASAGFATPVSSPVLALVVEPGKYRFLDFVRIGLPLLVLVGLVTVLVTPVFFPL
jgi:di/tricarboxylate transporter